MARFDSEWMTWRDALAVLCGRGWDRTELLDDLLALVASPHFRWEMPLPLISLAVRNELALDEARALMCLARAWLMGGDATRDALERRIRDLHHARRPGPVRRTARTPSGRAQPNDGERR